MKKILFYVFLLIVPFNVFATSYNTSVSNDLGTLENCNKFQDKIYNLSGQGYLGHCKKATCTTGEYSTSYHIDAHIGKCSNGNQYYYTQIVSDGCSQYKGSCTPSFDTKYCSQVVYYDCTKNMDGTLYVVPTTKKTTTTTTTRRTTTRRPIYSTNRTTSTTTTTTMSTTTITTTTQVDDNNYLKSLVISEGKIEFKKDIIMYNIEVDSSVKSIQVEANAESDKARVEISNNNGIKDNTPINIKVTAENGSVRIYTINVKYKDNKPVLSSNNLLKSIVIDKYSNFKFNPKKNKYSLRVEEDVTELNINVESQDEKSSYVINGNKNLKNGSKINIIVTAEDGKKNTYTIKIKKRNNLIIGVIILLLLGVIFVVLFKILRKVVPARQDKNYSYE